MTFESLANELLLDLFEYFNTVDLFHVFYNLNSRFNILLSHYFRNYHLNFQSISKHNFDLICQQYLPFILHQTISLHLSDDDETPTLPKLFLDLGYTLNEFIRLKSLTLNHIYSFDTIYIIIIQCHSLPSLTHLSLLKCQLHEQNEDIPHLLNTIWSLSKLTHCNLSNMLSKANLMSTIKIISTSMKCLSLDNIPCDLSDLTNLFTHTPHLQRFRTNISPSCQNQQLELIVPSILSLKIFYPNSISCILMIRHMPNLRYLTIKTTNICLNGNEWEILFADYLPNIEKFRLKMEFIFPLQIDVQYQINQLLETFRTPFWLEKHQWFVRCSSTIRNRLHIGILHTLPYTFEEFCFNNELYSESTCPNEKEYWSYDSVQTLHIKKYNNENFAQQCVRLSNIRYLKSNLPFNDKLWSCISSFDQLRSLEIELLSKDLHYHLLQILCERAPRLYSLKFHSLNEFNNACITSFLSSKTTSIRRLDFLGSMNVPRNQCYDNEACVMFASSTVGCQCEVLLIEVKQRTDVLYLINNMNNLRMLIFRCEYDRWIDKDAGMRYKNEKLFQWFQNHLPPSCLIIRDSNLASSYMRLWID